MRSIVSRALLHHAFARIVLAHGLLLIAAGLSRADESVAVGALLRDPRALAAWVDGHSPDLAAARERVIQAEADLAKSRLLQNPELSFSLGDVVVGRTNPPNLSFDRTAVYTAGVAQTIELGKRGPREASAGLRLEAGRAAVRDTLVQKLSEARAALAKVVDEKVKGEALAAAAENADAALALARVRLKHGDLAGVDVDRLDLETIGLEEAAAHEHAELAAALESCHALLRAACDGGAASAADLGGIAIEPPGPDALQSTLTSRADVAALLLQARSAREDARLASRKIVPDPTIGVTYTEDRLTISGDQPRSLLFSLGLPLPLFDHGAEDAAAAESKARELEQTARATLERSLSDVRGLLGRREQARASLEKLRTQAIPESERVVKTTATAFDHGDVSLTDLLLARRAHTDLLLREIDESFDLFDIDNDLRVALGSDAALAEASDLSARTP